MTAPSSLASRFGQLSLARRMLLGALLWSVLLVIGGVFAISAVYRAEATNLLDDEHAVTIQKLSGAVRPLDDGTGRIEDVEDKYPEDPRFSVPLSGKYWMMVAVNIAGEPVGNIQSRSVFDEDLAMPEYLRQRALERPGTVISGNSTGPADEPLRLSLMATSYPERETPILLVTGSDRTLVMNGVDRLRTILLISMLALAMGTLIAMALGLRYALRPLDRIQSDLAEIRDGRQAALTGDYPSEVLPLSEELNKMLEHNRQVVARARTHVGNLAHALKTPIAVLQNEATGDTQLDDVVLRQTRSMRSNVDHYLTRAQAAARAEALGTRTSVHDAVSRLARMMNKLFARDGKVVETDIPAELFVRVEQQDLEEMVGNLLENACKWADREISVSAEPGENAQVLIYIDDDGPGLTPQERIEAMKRGVRLDETAPGTGLGLSIVADIAGMNGGSFDLAESPSGGLRAILSLRRA